MSESEGWKAKAAEIIIPGYSEKIFFLHASRLAI